MALSQREKYIAIGVGGAIALYGLNSAVLDPYFSKLDLINTQTDTARQQLADRADLFTRQSELKKVWSSMTRSGLTSDPSAADSQSARAVLTWIGESGVAVTNTKTDRTTDENQFQILGDHFTCTGDTQQVTKLMWDLETATIPIRLTDVQITPRKEGTDDLTIQFGVSTLVRSTAADGTAPPAASASAGNDGGNAS